MKIKFLVFGKLKCKEYEMLVSHYLKNINFFIDAQIIELKDIPEPKNINDTNINLILKQEFQQLTKYINNKNYLIVCDSHGKQMDSVVFSNNIQKIINNPIYDNIIFIIGSSNGLCNEIKQQAKLNISFGLMTYPHNLMRVILLEQVYRAFAIIYKRNYHK